MFKKIFLFLILISTLSSAAIIKTGTEERPHYLNPANVTEITYNSKKQKLLVNFTTNTRSTLYAFSVPSKEKAEEIILKVFDTDDKSIIHLSIE